MDYVEWCDYLAAAMADYAETQHSRRIHLHSFAGHLMDTTDLSDAGVQRMQCREAAIRDSHKMLQLLGLEGNSPSASLKYDDLEALRDNYSRWVAASSLSLDNMSLLLLGTLNQMSQDTQTVPPCVGDVPLDDIIAEVNRTQGHNAIDIERAGELLDELETLRLVEGSHHLGPKLYSSTYLGIVRTERSHIAQDREIDVLRTAGEGDTLDYKRHYKLKTSAQKHEFVKDVTALVNAGGVGPRYLLLGVEDDGEFFAPSGSDEREEHKRMLDAVTETRIQEIVSSRTTVSPSVRIAARGDHRNGPYVLIEVTRRIDHLPYRVFDDQNERNAADANDRGEVWVRKGSTKALATTAEIEHLKNQAALFRQTRTQGS